MVAAVDKLDDDVYLTDVQLLCVECQRPIKARINTPNWIKVEWISGDGQCRFCFDKSKEEPKAAP